MAAGFAPRHERVWDWFEALEGGIRPRPLVEIWPRGGAKSTTVELAATWAGCSARRKFVLYVSDTQAQADKHLQAMAELLEAAGVGRAVNKYHQSKGWTQQILRADNGFNVVSYGLDAGARGVKLGRYRPDLIVLDDVDGRHDSSATTAKKIETITQSILPAGSSDCAIVFVQNLIHAHSVASQLADGRADFLRDRLPVVVEPALRGMDYESELQPDGTIRYRITAGEATWEGQSRATCEQQINDWGADAFSREAQHEVAIPKGLIYAAFKASEHTCPPFTIDPKWQRYLGLDFGGVHTASVLLAEEPGTKRLYLYREYLHGDRTGKEHAEALLKDEPMVPFCVGGSPSEGQWRKEFRMGGLPVNPPDIGEVEIGIDRVKAVIRAGGLIIFNDCTGILQELRTYAREVDETGQPTEKIANKSKYHLLDSLRYILGRIRRG